MTGLDGEQFRFVGVEAVADDFHPLPASMH